MAHEEIKKLDYAKKQLRVNNLIYFIINNKILYKNSLILLFLNKNII